MRFHASLFVNVDLLSTCAVIPIMLSSYFCNSNLPQKWLFIHFKRYWAIFVLCVVFIIQRFTRITANI